MQKIIELCNKAKEIFGNTIRLIYFCPLNYKNIHFTLLEINKQEKVICHYDLMADKDVIDDIMKQIRMDRLMQMRYFFDDKDGDISDAIVGEI